MAKVSLLSLKLLCLSAGISGGDVGLHDKNPTAQRVAQSLVCFNKEAILRGYKGGDHRDSRLFKSKGEG